VTQFDEELAALWRRYRSDAPAGSHRSRQRDGENQKWEPRKADINQSVAGAVPTVPAIPTSFDKIQTHAPAEVVEIDPGEWEERAAILEYEGGLDRAAAEELATILVRRN
jgi:hypothetical protein